jgi:chromosome segregation ATPase
MENIYQQINSSKGVLVEEMCRINKVQAMRQNSIMELIERNKDNMDEVKQMLRDLMQKIENNVGRNEANSTMLNQNIEQNIREVRSLVHVINKLQLDITNLNNIVVKLQKKVQENSVKIENKSEKETRKEKINDQKSQNKKGKIKKKDESSDSDDENNDLHRPKELSEENCQDKDIIEILRNDKKFKLREDWHMINNIDWKMLTNML